MTAQNNSQNARSVNSQITDAITQTNMLTLGLAPAQSIGTLYQTTAQAVGTAMQNAVANQQNMYSLSLASTTQNLQSLLSLSSAAASRGTSNILSQRQLPIATASYFHPAPAATVHHTAAPGPAATHPAAKT
tara:strand:+ start:562 stop:957 length:396 start_codon:yes stop_codon:yes gene_type:complete